MIITCLPIINQILFWYNANPINQCDTSQFYRDIHLIHVDSLVGDLVLNGYISSDASYDVPFAGLNLLLGNEKWRSNFKLVLQMQMEIFKFEKISCRDISTLC